MDDIANPAPTSKSSLVYSRNFIDQGDSFFVLPGRSVPTYEKLAAVLYKLHKKDPATWDVHIHLEDTACHGVVSEVTWDEGIYLEASDKEKLELFPHFLLKPDGSALKSRSDTTPTLRGLVSRPTSASSTMMRSNKPASTPIKTFARTNTGSPQVGLMSELTHATGTSNPNTTTHAHATTNPKPKPKYVHVAFNYFQGTAGVFKNFRNHSQTMTLHTPCDEIRAIVSAAVTHSVNSSSRLRKYRSQIEYEVFVAASHNGTDAASVERPLDEAKLLTEHADVLGSDKNLLVHTYLFLAKKGVRYEHLEDAMPDANEEAAEDEDVSVDWQEHANVKADKYPHANENGNGYGEGSRGNSTFKTSHPAPTPAPTYTTTSTPSPLDLPSLDLPSRSLKRKHSQGPYAPLSHPTQPHHDAGVLVGSLRKSSYLDGRKNAVVATLSSVGRILCYQIDEDIAGNSLSVRGVPRTMPEDIEYLDEFKGLGRDALREEIRKRLGKEEGGGGEWDYGDDGEWMGDGTLRARA